MEENPFYPLDPAAWAQQHFGAAQLGDIKRVRRAVTLAAGMARQPGSSIPQLFLHRYDVKAAYTLLDHPEVTPQHLQAGHQSLVKARLHMPGTYLLLEDSTELGWTRVHSVEGLASIGNLQSNQCRGFLLHTTLAVHCLHDATDDQPQAGRPAVEVLGIADQEYLLKKPRPAGEKVGDVRSSQKRADHLSMVWLRGGARLGNAPEDGGRSESAIHLRRASWSVAQSRESPPMVGRAPRLPRAGTWSGNRPSGSKRAEGRRLPQTRQVEACPTNPVMWLTHLRSAQRSCKAVRGSRSISLRDPQHDGGVRRDRGYKRLAIRSGLLQIGGSLHLDVREDAAQLHRPIPWRGGDPVR